MWWLHYVVMYTMADIQAFIPQWALTHLKLKTSVRHVHLGTMLNLGVWTAACRGLSHEPVGFEKRLDFAGPLDAQI